MGDRGEKIICLAREMLQSGTLTQPVLEKEDKKKNDRTLALKAACLAALLAATGTATIDHIVRETNRPANRYERVEIDALAFYAAQQLGGDHKAMLHEVTAAVGLSETGEISVSDYRRARDYLRQRIQGGRR